MRLFVGLVLLLCQLSLGLIWLLQPVQRSSFERFVPQDILGLMVLTHPPSRLDFLEGSSLGRWFDLGSEDLEESIPDAVREQVVPLFRDELESVWLLIHHLEGKPEGSWRIHFTGLLKPQPFQRPALELRIERAVKDIFGGAQISEHQNVRLYRGSEPGHVLYQVEMPDFLLISNSEEGWQKTLRTIAGEEASLAETASFRRVQSHLRMDGGLFLYFKANRLFPLFPEFGYLIRWHQEEFSEDYYEIR
jgi:hypothetical protein